MITDRANAICILEILREYSDEQHILPMKELTAKMHAIYGLKPDRRTVYSAIALLIDLGYDISIYEENGTGYFLRGRDFEPSEVRLLMDAVYSFPFLPKGQSELLIDKLQKLLSKHQRRKYRNLTIVRSGRKSSNKQVFLNMEVLDEAITARKQVSFTYLTYGADKRLHPRRERAYTVNPYRLVYMNEHYYLVCNLSGYPNTSLYRIDLMHDINVLETEWDRTEGCEDEVKNAVYAFAGRPEHIVLSCSEDIIGDVIDRFGTDIHISKSYSDRVTVSFFAPPQGIRFWALQYMAYAEIWEPKWLRDEIIECVANSSYIQQNP